MCKILMLFQDSNLPSSRVRVLNLVPELTRHGFNVTAIPYPKNVSDKINLISKLKNFEVVFLQKKLLTQMEYYCLRRFSKLLLFDFDDAIYIKDDNASQSFSRTRLQRFKYIVKKADLVIAGNPGLGLFASQYNARITILPSAVPVTAVCVRDWSKQHERPVIGWVGGGGNLHHLAMIAPALQAVAKDVNFELRVVSDKEFHLEGVTVNNILWKLETQEAEIANFDIGIMPMPKNQWTEGKCSYKLLQYMAAGVPVVASNWGFNNEVINNGENGFLAGSNDEFGTVLKYLLDNKVLCSEIGTKGRSLVERDFSLESVGRKLASALTAIINITEEKV
ncbi:glycosyltransferase family 4 protein [Pelotalea chapellei]|uniref:Glycosyltransferase family 4 protein n=1 Tax=Pelotalea chapellei TaxID=44671 RepID=A0ABS5U6S0_9BACT|nr:glycosyltransferase family 4 protein [Pelotalea chapellei]MBT1071366.1 glycosyltransferase family 4 protein [Pelotalea chapellei]